MSLLNELGLKYRTDKATDGKRGEPGKGHNYLHIYESFVLAKRLQVKKVLEVGVQRGASVRMWEEYFPNATIYGLDIAETALNVAAGRIVVDLVDQSDAKALEAFASRHGPFDLIVDDGSHIWAHQITSLQVLLPFVSPGGHYIVEDLHTSYSAQFGTPGGTTGIQYVLQCCERIVGGARFQNDKSADPFLRSLQDQVAMVSVLRHSAVFSIRS